MKTLDMRFIRYLNLFEKVTNVRTKYSFFYNHEIIFVVPRSLLARTIGEDGRNVKKLVSILGMKVKILAFPNSDADAKEFIASLVYPMRLRSIDIMPNELILNAGRQSKAILIGRNKTRLQEMQEIVKEYFNRDARIV